MSDDEEAGPPLVHQGTGLSLTLPEADGNDRGDVDGSSGQMAELMLALEDGQEWKTSVDVSFTVEFVKALARNHFVDLKDADYLELQLDGRPLIDPMSLIDYGIQADGGKATRLLLTTGSSD